MKNRRMVYFLATMLLWTSTKALYAQYGFDVLEDFNTYTPGFFQSEIHSILTDDQRIVVAGLGSKNNGSINTNDRIGFLGAFDHLGNLIWKKQMVFAPPYQSNEPYGRGHSLIKLFDNVNVVGAHSYDSNFALGHYIPRPFLYFFSNNGDSLKFVPMPYDQVQHMNFLNSIVKDRQDNILAAGTYWNKPIADSAGIWLAKFDGSGNFLWRKTIIDTPYYATGAKAFKVLNGNNVHNYLIAGIAGNPDSMNTTPFTLWKTDTSGNVLWRKGIPWASEHLKSYESLGDQHFDITPAIDASGYYFIATAVKTLHWPNEPTSYRSIYYCGKVDEQGEIVWAKNYERDSLHFEYGASVLQKDNGDLLFNGVSLGYNTPEAITSSGATLFCTNSDGSVKWFKVQKHFDCSINTVYEFQSMQFLSDHKIALGGQVFNAYVEPGCIDSIGALAWLVVTDSLGRRFTEDTLTLPLQEEAATFPGDTTLSVDGQKSDLPQINIYPNPTKDKVYVSITDLKGNATMVKALLYDYTGRLIKTQKFKTASEPIDLKGYSPGLYILMLRYKNQDIGTWKLIKQ